MPHLHMHVHVHISMYIHNKHTYIASTRRNVCAKFVYMLTLPWFVMPKTRCPHHAHVHTHQRQSVHERYTCTYTPTSIRTWRDTHVHTHQRQSIHGEIHMYIHTNVNAYMERYLHLPSDARAALSRWLKVQLVKSASRRYTTVLSPIYRSSAHTRCGRH